MNAKIILVGMAFLFLAIVASAFEPGDPVTEQQLLSINANTIGLECEHDFTRVNLKRVIIEHQTSCLDLVSKKDSNGTITGYMIIRNTNFVEYDAPDKQAIKDCFFNNSPLTCFSRIVNYLLNHPEVIQELHDIALERHLGFVGGIREHIFELQMEAVGNDINIPLDLTEQELNP